jgi:hypothetical protein
VGESVGSESRYFCRAWATYWFLSRDSCGMAVKLDLPEAVVRTEGKAEDIDSRSGQTLRRGKCVNGSRLGRSTDVLTSKRAGTRY